MNSLSATSWYDFDEDFLVELSFAETNTDASIISKDIRTESALLAVCATYLTIIVSDQLSCL